MKKIMNNVQGEIHILGQKMDSEENRHNESKRSFPVAFSQFKNLRKKIGPSL